MDKYYMLVRRFVNASFRLLIRTGWHQDTCREYNNVLTGLGGPLWCVHDVHYSESIQLTFCDSPSDLKVPTSLAFHLADIYIEELDKALANVAAPTPPAPLHTLIHPFLILAAQTPSSVAYKHIQSALFDPLFSALFNCSLADESPSQKRARLNPAVGEDQVYSNVVANACYEDPLAEGNVDGLVLHRKLLKSVFDIASQPETKDSNRRKMYTLWKHRGEDGDSND